MITFSIKLHNMMGHTLSRKKWDVVIVILFVAT